MSPARPFRFGVSFWESFEEADDLLRVARRAEQLGYSSLLVGDHFVDYDPPPLPTLAWVAAQTTRLRIGTLVLGNDFRHPAVVARDAAALDRVSGGRLELGLGAGWLQGDYAAIGLPYDEPRVRIDRLSEALTVVKGCWRGEPFDFTGEHYEIREYAARPLPLQQPRPPILVGGGSPRVLRLAGREADIVGIHPSAANLEFPPDTDEDLRRKIGWVREGAGERFEQLELMADGESLPAGIEEACETVRRRRDSMGLSYVFFSASELEARAPIVERLAGG